jgi:hypothetical protein
MRSSMTTEALNKSDLIERIAIKNPLAEPWLRMQLRL